MPQTFLDVDIHLDVLESQGAPLPGLGATHTPLACIVGGFSIVLELFAQTLEYLQQVNF